MSQERQHPLDTATGARLRKLRNLPVDASTLRRRLEGEMRRDEARQISFWRRPIVRIAAAVLLAAGPLALVVISMLPREAVASPEQFAALHQQMQSHGSMLTPVADMAGAQRTLKQQWASAPDMPDGLPHEQMACCVHKVAGRKTAVVTIRGGNEPVTMAVVDASEVTIPRSGLLQYKGREYSAETVRGVNMIMFERAGKSVCIMGTVPQEELLKLADAAKF